MGVLRKTVDQLQNEIVDFYQTFQKEKMLQQRMLENTKSLFELYSKKYLHELQENGK